MKKLENYGVKSINTKEMKRVNGGAVDPVTATVVAIVAIAGGLYALARQVAYDKGYHDAKEACGCQQ